MTTPGHQAGPTPANGRHAPGNDVPDRDGGPAAGDAGYEDTGRYDPPEDGYGTYSPEDRYSSYAPSGETPDWFGPSGSGQGPGGLPQGTPGRHGAPGDGDDRYSGSPGAPGHYGTPGNGQDWSGAAGGGQGRYGPPAADEGRYGENTARMSTPETHGRPPARHAAGPDGEGPDAGGPGQAGHGGTGDWAQNQQTQAFRSDGYPPEAYQDQSYPSQNYPDQGYPSQNYQDRGEGSQGYPSQNYPSQNYPSQNYPSQNYPSQNYPDQGYPSQNYQGQGEGSQGYPSQGYPSEAYPGEADWIEAKWTGADRVQAASPAQAAAGPAQAGPAAWSPVPPRPGPAPGAERTAVAAPDTGDAGSGRATTAANSSLLRSSSVMAVGTLASRLTGFVRNAVIIYAIGTLYLGDAYNLANTLPNVVYNLALGGILTSVVVPLLVNAAKRDADRGEGYDQRIFTLGVLALGAITLVATLLAQPITAIYAGNIGNHAAYHLTVIFAYFFIPQIFFYGVSSLAGAILNARGSFAAPMWTPVINNLVVIVIGVGFMATAGLNRTPGDITSAQVELLGIGTTLGIVLQTVALIPSMRRVGFRWRPRHDFRRAEISEIGHMSGWMFGYVLTTQISFLVTTRIANVGGAGAQGSQHAVGAGFAAYSNAYTLFQLPYAIVGISVITALLPRMSAHAAERKYGLVSSDFSTAVRLASVVVVPAALILAVLGPPLAEAVFGYGSTSVASAQYVGEIFAVFSLGLLPFTLFQLLLRVFYSMHDSRTPALISVVTMVINIVANLIALAVLPPRHVVAGLGAGFGLASVAGTVAAWRVLSRRIGGLDGHTVRAGLVRMHAAAIPGAIFAIAVTVMIGAALSGGRIAALFTVAVGGSGAMLLYVLFAKSFGVAELNDLTKTVRARLR
jgi:putative peptidoglycan lipid II flippase